jgi:hypothetical protein
MTAGRPVAFTEQPGISYTPPDAADRAHRSEKELNCRAFVTSGNAMRNNAVVARRLLY